MAHIVELRGMSNERLEEMLENAREELFNLRFQAASARLENTARIRVVRREVAQIQEVLHKRQLAVEAAQRQPEIAGALADKTWNADVHFDYEQNGWVVTFRSKDGAELARALIDLNKKSAGKRKQRDEANLVKSYEVIG
ncbi:MAG: 50S ribosomal protein L29 [Chloroflexi bacterium]|jgi:large subunit ribosomal protein L29|nr:50S ribosomal protein L29 [Chloroflexota bacterium]